MGGCGELQAALAAFADNVFPEVDWGGKTPEELIARTRLAAESVLVQACDLLAEQHTDDELLRRRA